MVETKIITWSFSRLDTFKKCPKQFAHSNIYKDVPFKETEATLEGTRQHEMLEARVSKGTPFPVGYEHLEAIAAPILNAPGQTFTELELALDIHRRPCGYRDWKNAWVRAILDVLKINGSIAWAGDYKTGKRSSNFDQLTLAALVLFAHYHDVETVVVSYLWLKTGEIDSRTFKRTQIPELWRSFETDLEVYNEAHKLNNWPAKPSKLCAWCPANAMMKCDVAAAAPR